MAPEFCVSQNEDIHHTSNSKVTHSNIQDAIPFFPLLLSFHRKHNDPLFFMRRACSDR